MSSSNDLIRIVLAAALALSTGPSPAASIPAPSARTLAASLDRKGASAVLAELDRRPGRFDAVLSKIETGDPAWLRIASRLRPPADGAFAEGLDMAVARALPNEPLRVLALVDHGFALDRICTSPFIEPDVGVAEAYASRTVAALAKVGEPLRPIAAACAARVKLPTP